MKKMMKVSAAILGLALALPIALSACSEPGDSTPADPLGNYKGEKTNCLVQDKEMSYLEGKTQYRIYSSCGVFGVQDDVWIGQWNSADTYGSIQVGKTYDFEAYGWRNGFFSTFPNIKNATEVAK